MRIRTAKFHVDFETHVRTILFFRLMNMFELNALGGDTKLSITNALDFGVEWDAGVWENTKYELGLGLGHD